MKIECKACQSTGVIQGYMERPGTAVICVICKGEGFILSSDKLFIKRKLITGVSTVVSSEGYAISYEEFTAGKMPGPKKAE